MYINFLAWETAAVRIVILYQMSPGSRVYNHYRQIMFIIKMFKGSTDHIIKIVGVGKRINTGKVPEKFNQFADFCRTRDNLYKNTAFNKAD